MTIDEALASEHKKAYDEDVVGAAYEPVNGLERVAIYAATRLDGISVRLRALLARRPNAVRFLIAAFALASAFAFAGRRAGAQLLQMPIDTAYNLGYVGSGTLFINAFNLAQEIFVTLAVLSVIVSVVAYYIRQQTVQGLGKVVLSSVLRLGIPFLIIQAAALFVPTIAETGLQIASNIAGTAPSAVGYASATPTAPTTLSAEIQGTYNSVFNAPRNPYNVSNALTPGNIATLGAATAWDFCKTLFQEVQATHSVQGQNPNSNNGFDPVTQAAEQIVMTLMIVLSISIAGVYTFIAVELILAYLNIYLALPLGAWTLGFLGAPGTSRFGQGYWVMAAQALIRFVVIVFVIGFAVAVSDQMSTLAYNFIHNNGRPRLSLNPTNGIFNSADLDILKALISFTFASASILYIVRVLPSMIMSVIVGSVIGAEGNTAEGQLSGAGQGAAGRVAGYGRMGIGNTSGLGATGKISTPGMYNRPR